MKSFRKNLSCVLAFLGIALFSFSCSPQKEGRVLRVNLGSEPQSLDPRKARDFSAQACVRMFFEGLIRKNPEGKKELALADRIEASPDGTVYRIHLKKGYWSSGDPVLASDFVYAWSTLLSPSFPSDLAHHLYVIKNGKEVKSGKKPVSSLGVRALDLATLEIELEVAIPYFEDLLATTPFFPVHQKRDETNPLWAAEGATFVGNGPFQMKEWSHSDRILGVKSPSYWDANAVSLQKIELVMVSDQTELAMFTRGELDLAGSPLSSLPIDALKSLEKEKQFHKKPFLATSFIRLNIEHPPLNHSLVRKALGMSICRKDLVEHVLHGHQTVATSLVPSSMGLQKEALLQEGDQESASELLMAGLKELKLEKGALSKLRLMFAASDRNRSIAQAIQEDIRKNFGETPSLEPVERKVYYDRLSSMKYDLALGSWTADCDSPIDFLKLFQNKKSQMNSTGWESATYDALLARAVTSVDPDEQRLLFQESEKILMDEQPIIPLFHYNLLYLKNEALDKVAISTLGEIDFKWATFQ